MKTYFRKKRGDILSFTTKYENPRFNFSKKAIFDDQKVSYVGSSSDSMLFNGRVNIYRVPGQGPSTEGEDFFRLKKGGEDFFPG